MVLPGWEAEEVALLDTGFTGELIIPWGVLPQDLAIPGEFINVEVGDNRVVPTSQYPGQLVIPGLSTLLRVSVTIIGDEYIVGIGIIERYRITLDRGERVIVEL